MTQKPAKVVPSIEEVLKDLEKIVQELEKGQLGLEESLVRFEKGVHLYQLCHESLVEAEKKVRVLSEGLKEEEWLD